MRKIVRHFFPIIHQLQGRPVAVGCLLPCGFSCHFPQVCEDTYQHRDSRSPLLLKFLTKTITNAYIQCLKLLTSHTVQNFLQVTDGSRNTPYPTTRPHLPHVPERKSGITEKIFRCRFLFLFIWFSWAKIQNLIKRKSIFVFRLFILVSAKNRKR